MMKAKRGGIMLPLFFALFMSETGKDTVILV